MDAEPDATLADDEARLAAFAHELVERVDAAIAGWVVRSLRDKGGLGFVEADVAPVVDATRNAIMPALRQILGADVDAGGGSPLAALRAGVGPMTERLTAWGAARPPRDEFQERQFPGDPYELGPAAFADVDLDLHEPGLMWGAARAHVHLRRRREAADG